MFKRYDRNAVGRDYAVGDIHGCFAKLQTHLDRIGFNPDVDRLFSVGDLVDRGPESAVCLEWLNKPWFHAVRGNHEQMAIDFAAGFDNRLMYMMNGGTWLMAMPRAEYQPYIDAFADLPIAMEVETAAGSVGIVHADCPVRRWDDLKVALESENTAAFQDACMWSRSRATGLEHDDVAGVEAVVVGHTPMPRWTTLGNVIYIDTGACYRGDFTILDLGTLRPAGQTVRQVDWSDDVNSDN